MEKFILFSILSVSMLVAFPEFSQTYKTIADTAALNSEYAKVSAEINDLNSKLAKAKSERRIITGSRATLPRMHKAPRPVPVIKLKTRLMGV